MQLIFLDPAFVYIPVPNMCLQCLHFKSQNVLELFLQIHVFCLNLPDSLAKYLNSSSQETPMQHIPNLSDVR